MSRENIKTAVLRGKTMYAKILGNPVLNYSGDAKEWKMDFVLDKNTIKEVKALGIGDRVKQKDDYLEGQSYLTFKQSEFRKDGTSNFPIKVEDISGAPWPQEKLIGNGSVVDVKFVVMDHGVGKKKGVYIRSVRVLDLVTYNKSEFSKLDEDDPYFANLRQVEEANRAQKEAEDKAFKKTFLNEDASEPDKGEVTPDDDLSDDVPF